MSRLRIALCTLYLLLGFAAQAQTSYWVYFTDKHQCTFNPQTYFAPEALQRRVLHPQAITDSSDFPVNTHYLNKIAKHVDTLGYASRWLNAVSVVATPKQLEEIAKFPFVKRIAPQLVSGAPTICAQPKSVVPDTISGDTIIKTSEGEFWPSKQIGSMKGQLFTAENYRAKGIVIAIFDVGFQGVDKHKAFEQIRFNNRIRATFDFYTDNWNVYAAKDDHGTMVLSCIAGTMNGSPMGLATDATFLLARIGKAYSNQYRYEERWMAALEWSDKQGVNIINCSGGPNQRAYFQEQMDGKTAVVSVGAKLAAKKGILVVAAAGNNGEFGHPSILPPSDADSVICVSATDYAGVHSPFSSYGPTPDFRRKPDVCAPGMVVVATADNSFDAEDGTSFSCPLVAGFAACLLEMYPDSNVMAVLRMVQRAGSLYPYYDYAHGYGIPQATAFIGLSTNPDPTVNFILSDDAITIKTNPSLTASEKPAKQLLYWSVSDASGRILEYHVVEFDRVTEIVLKKEKYQKGFQIHISCNHYYANQTF